MSGARARLLKGLLGRLEYWNIDFAGSKLQPFSNRTENRSDLAQPSHCQLQNRVGIPRQTIYFGQILRGRPPPAACWLTKDSPSHVWLEQPSTTSSNAWPLRDLCRQRPCDVRLRGLLRLQWGQHDLQWQLRRQRPRQMLGQPPGRRHLRRAQGADLPDLQRHWTPLAGTGVRWHTINNLISFRRGFLCHSSMTADADSIFGVVRGAGAGSGSG